MVAATVELSEPRTLSLLLKTFDLHESINLSISTADYLQITASCIDSTKFSIYHPVSNRSPLDGCFSVDAKSFLDALDIIFSICGNHILWIVMRFDLEGDHLELAPKEQLPGEDLTLHVRLIQTIREFQFEEKNAISISLPIKIFMKLIPDHLLSDSEALLCAFDEGAVAFSLASVKGKISNSHQSGKNIQPRVEARIPIPTLKSLKSLLRHCDDCSISLSTSLLAFNLNKVLTDDTTAINILLWVS